MTILTDEAESEMYLGLLVDDGAEYRGVGMIEVLKLAPTIMPI